MDYKQRIGMGGGPMMPAGMTGSNQMIGGNIGTSFSANGSATGPAFVLIALVGFLVLDYVWTRGHQGGR